MRNERWRSAVGGWLLASSLGILGGCGDPPATSEAKPLSVATILGDPAVEGYARATGPVPFAFPRDDGPHPDYRSEWWYWTGNLRTADGRAFGYQFTVFRFALAPSAPQRTSAWATREAWMAHLTLTDAQGRRFVAQERSARGAAGLAGAQADPFRVWCDGWSVDGNRLRAEAGDVALDLALQPGKPAVLQGDRGYSRKGADPANASLYYSRTRMPTSGTIRLGSETFTVDGASWMDREWSTSALEPGVVGWDWFALQLDDGRDLMFYRLRTADGAMTPFSGGTLVARDGSSERLTADEVKIAATASWTSQHGVRYPSAWSLRVRDIDLTIAPRIPDQELDVSVRYWEGAVVVSGSQTGVGYVELAGY